MNNLQKTHSSMQGILSGCPFCAAMSFGIPQIGTRFRIISGYSAGVLGTVVEWPKNFTPLPNEFLSQMDNAQPHEQCRVLLEHELIQVLPQPPIPDWAPPLCLTDAAELDSVVLRFCDRCYRNGKWHLEWQAFYDVIKRVWILRLPIEPHELWAVLRAHGCPGRWEKKLVKIFTQGRDLLVHSCGRKPIKNKRVVPFSV